MDPNQPEGLLDVVLISQVRFRAMKGIPNKEFGILRTVEEMAPPAPEKAFTIVKGEEA